MDIDFHFGVMYVVARLAGMDAPRAEIVAHACQYVDDATAPDMQDADLTGRGGGLAPWALARPWVVEALFNPGNVMAWAPFHFVPGGEGSGAEERTVCRAGGAAAAAAVRHAIEQRNSAIGLYRLGVSLHAYVDTWAHQGFSGLVSRNNAVLFLEGDEEPGEPGAWTRALQRTLRTASGTAAALALDVISRLGHSSALHFPDMPWLKWGYRNGHNQRVDRDNLPAFLTAADMACRAVRGYLGGNTRFEREPGLPPEAREALRRLFEHNRSRSSRKRLAVFAAGVARGGIPGLMEALPPYAALGPGSWRHEAADDARGAWPARLWRDRCDISHHHRVLQAMEQHRSILVRDILPAQRVVLGA
ncbi:MAG TPA: DUF6765 family protein [Burkholderiales bacterium]|nr:DUF6765 family protein [Burkholderiales bacterium]